ncbi:ABC-type transport system involved in multi-copper enzyme maturation permease subunit [Kineococcus xinjiangensis]|uniref:ABC-type transport system involved in multi-copper enzyme maturation permease subunit n=1 Tax=Kineococcus xinjiangensis TaxID=512762 RepID=A0A2S6IGX2_9ACTN|nr:ABC transporter permease subunit [Kineococcus xinjiangensis]PPK93459.1 ABC-type transport system involved in multi-copper enzyme maturation permease subunit [Kineococcus xinjiangensis]
MSTTTLSKAERPQYRAPEHRLTFAGQLRSEWIKFWSVRSIVWTMVASAVVTVGLGAAFAALTASFMPSGEASEVRGMEGFGLTVSMGGAQFATLVIAAVGVIVIAGEYSTGMIRTSFTAAPGRVSVLLAKAVVLALAVTLVLGAAVFAAFFLGQALLSATDLDDGIGDPDVLRLLVGNVVVLVGVALAGLGLGALMRNTAGAICTMVALLFVLPIILMLPILPDFPGKDALTDYNFASTMTALTTPEAMGPQALSVTTSAVAFAVWVLAFLAAGALVLKRRDV